MEDRLRRHPPKPLMLWCDLAFTPQDRGPRMSLACQFRICYTTRPDRVLEDVARFEPAALCFEIDHLDGPRAAAFEEVVSRYPRLPALLITVEHSEALAVWAFRAGAWNYLVKPVASAELAANAEGLLTASAHRTPARSPRPPGAHAPPIVAATHADARIAQFEPALQYVRRHYGEKVTETEAARRCGMKRFSFSHGFHEVFGVTFREYLMRTRIGEAQRLLIEGGRSITEIAFASGFTDGSYFARTFRRYMGVLPSEYGRSIPAAFPAP